MIMRNKGKRLPKSVDVRSFNRPMKVAFLVPSTDNESSQWILDGVFSESYSRWGGSRSLIIPFSNGNPLDDQYEDWLAFLDPDFIYSYIDLDIQTIERLNRLALPIAFIRHDDSRAKSWRGYIPSWSTFIDPVQAISTLTSPYSEYPGWSKTPSPKIYVKQHPENCANRFLPDNFAVSLSTSTEFLSHHGVYESICYVPEEIPENYVVGTYRCSSLTEILGKIANKEVQYIAKLSSIHVKGIPAPNDYQWRRGFRIILGDTVLDRINFWNIRHFFSSYDMSDSLSSLIINPELLEDEGFCKSIGAFLNNHNFIGQGNGPIPAFINSYSLDIETCKRLMGLLQGEKNTWNQLLIDPNFSINALPQKDMDKRRGLVSGLPVPSFKLNDTENDFAATGPDHFKYLPPNFLFVRKGQWLVDIKLERHNDNSTVVNVYNDWVLPRRLEIMRAFTNNLGKINNQGGLSLVPASDRGVGLFDLHDVDYKIHLSMPEDETVFRWLSVTSINDVFHDYRQDLQQKKYYAIRISDKGQNHRGIVSKFTSVTEAASILTNKFWRELIRKCANCPSTKNTIKQLEGPVLGLSRPEMEYINKSLNFDNLGNVKKYLKSNLTDVVEYLVHIGILYQVHIWRCSYCGNSNKRALNSLTIENFCDICGEKYLCPIDFEFSYSPSAFVVDALGVRSGLTVLWTVSHLFERSWGSGSIYLPEVNLIKSEENDEDRNEIDILAIIEGKFVVSEVKYSVESFIDNPEEISKFTEIINKLNPDVAILAFEVYDNLDSPKKIEEISTRFRDIFDELKTKIPSYVDFRYFVARDVKEFRNFPIELGPWGERTLKVCY